MQVPTRQESSVSKLLILTAIRQTKPKATAVLAFQQAILTKKCYTGCGLKKSATSIQRSTLQLG